MWRRLWYEVKGRLLRGQFTSMFTCLQGSYWDPESGQECTVAQDLSGETPGSPEVLVLVEHL